jgi:DEAD/DEAH box helicase domain-containing protein
VTTQHFIPVESPWIDVRGDWSDLPSSDRGRFRVSTRGHVFHQSRGINGTGYALCLACGRTEPMTYDNACPAIFQTSHRKLRGSKEDGGSCLGSNDSWKVKHGISLGHEFWTDAVEFQLMTYGGSWLSDVVVATTLAVAMRNALAELIGVQANELACETRPSRTEFGDRCQSIFIFDRFAAGYASNVARHMNAMFCMSRERLMCSKNCDSACPNCVLDFEHRFAADNLDRKVALEFLNENWLATFER